MGRPRKYETAAQRQAAYRARDETRVVEVRLHRTTADTLDQLAQALAVSRNEVVSAVISHGLLNRDWFRLGLRPDLKKLPYARNPED